MVLGLTHGECVPGACINACLSDEARKAAEERGANTGLGFFFYQIQLAAFERFLGPCLI